MADMKPNVLFLIIDSLRADHFVGDERTCKTPIIDNLLKSGTYFENTYSSSDVTGTCLGNIFTGNYSFNTGITLHNFNEKFQTIFDILKKNNYNIYGMVPDLTWFHKLTKNFDRKETFFCANLEQDGLNDGIGEKILTFLNEKNNEPWFYYIHLQDLHEKIIPPENFKNKIFGDNEYDQQISFIDSWIEKILNTIDLEKTILIITSDHGYYNIHNMNTQRIPKVQLFMKKIKNILPFLEPIGIKFFIFIRNLDEYISRKKIKNELSSEESRSLTKKGGIHLYDEILHTPLFFCGNKIPQNIINNQYVSSVDIFPTLLNLLEINHTPKFLHGKNISFIHNEKYDSEKSIYIESGDIEELDEGKVIGIRTNNYKYLRSRKNPKKHVSLYDLNNDPNELNNISSNENLVKKMENILIKMLNKKTNYEKSDDLSDSELEEISAELKKMGYIN